MSAVDMASQSEELISIVNQTMPFGRFAGRKLIDLPEPYLVWFHTEGFPSGKLGERMAVMYEIKCNGLEGMLRPLVFPDESIIVVSESAPESALEKVQRRDNDD